MDVVCVLVCVCVLELDIGHCSFSSVALYWWSALDFCFSDVMCW